jgi:hypothetical protein
MSLDTPPPNNPLLNTQELRSPAPNLSEGRVLLGILKSIENELRKRELLGFQGTPPTPLWFLAETERNVFLWRSGQSLDDTRNYTFWVDIKALIEKRREQLRKPQDQNPFINPLWGSGTLDHSLVERECDYLDLLEDLIPTVFKRGETLSRASESLRLEMDPSAIRTAITLPLNGPPSRRRADTR